MAFKISEFIDTINKHGTLQTNKFDLVITNRLIPNGSGTIFESMKQVNNLDGFDRESFSDGYTIHTLRVDSVRLPGTNIDTVEARRYGVGPQIKTGTNARFEPLSISLIADKDFHLYKFFYTWLNTVFNFGRDLNRNVAPSFLTEYKDLYSTDVLVRVYENSGQMKNTFTFAEAFPIGISDPSLSWRDSNNLYKFDVTFAYTQWTMSNKPSPSI